MTYYKCDDCGERYDRTEVVFDEADTLVLCLDCAADMADQEARDAYAEYAPRPYDSTYACTLDDPKHPTYAERAWDAADERVVFA
jgi:hypothetical protein